MKSAASRPASGKKAKPISWPSVGFVCCGVEDVHDVFARDHASDSIILIGTKW
jgi:hypothetical protein